MTDNLEPCAEAINNMRKEGFTLAEIKAKCERMEALIQHAIEVDGDDEALESFVDSLDKINLELLIRGTGDAELSQQHGQLFDKIKELAMNALEETGKMVSGDSEEAVMDFFAKRCQQVKNWPAEAGKGRRAERTPTQPPSIGPPSIAPSMGRRAVSEGALTSISKTSISKTDEEALYTALHMGGGVDRFSSVT